MTTTPELVTVFQAGKDGYPTCRIPSLLTAADGTLLAFCEGRQQRDDHACNDIVLKRSSDSGRTWEPARSIADEGGDSLNDPSAVLDCRTGRIVLHYTRFAEGYHSDKAVPGYDDPHAARNYVIHSDDSGATWSDHLEVTRQVKRPDVRCAVTTCGIGIQLRRGPSAGRLVHAVYQFGGRSDRESYAIFSDDGGASWTMGAPAVAPDGEWSGEPQVVELADGRLMLNARTKTRRRRVAISEDGGATFSNQAADETLIDPACQASILRCGDPLDGAPSQLAFSNAASETERVNGTVRLSLDEGATWPVGRAICPGSFAYSCLAVLPDDMESGGMGGGSMLGCLFEADDYERIVLARISMDWLQEG
jgi:sialidase-1